MIEEDVLRELLADAGAAVPAPGQAPQALADALAAGSASSPRRRPRRMVLVAAAVVLVVLVGATVLNGGRDDGGDRQAGFVQAEGASTDSHDLAGRAAVAAGANIAAAGGAAAAPGAGGGSVGAPAAPGAAPAPASADTARVIRTGSLDLEVREGAFGATIDRVTSLAVGVGGYVAESTTTESSVPRGSVTLRIPAASFDQSVTELRRLGKVKRVTSKGTDVTAQFTDLAARLSALSATRDRLFEVLRGARNVGDVIAVQDRITGVQTEIEQIQGRQRLLTDQTSFGTLAVTLAEPGADKIETTATDEGLGGAWDEAKRRFGDTIEGLIEWSGTAAVVAIVGLLIAGLGRFAWPRARRRLV